MENNFNGIFTRAKNLIITPKSEWETIALENRPHVEVFGSYLIWMVFIPVLAVVIGNYSNLGLGIKLAVEQLIAIIGGAYLTAWVFNELAPKYGAEKNFNKAFELVAYCYTASCVGGIFFLFGGLKLLTSVCSLYGLYLLYVGLKPMMNVPDDKLNNYFVVALLCMVGIAIVLGLLFTVGMI